ncbi:cytochrome b5-like [Microplitis mediator]|uniref:cytochrome b5-like n=1 Tax=Microplitis mediator TaxID=375433 RepID=UPI0025537D1B|nr:cytochrome b5-like [Microplitis mediator]
MSDNLYSLQEVSKHNNNESTWIIIKSSVYDVTDFLNEHPGGAELIKECAGKNATSDFNNSGHSSDARRTMKLYKIGEISEESKVINDDISDKENLSTKKRKIFIPLFCNCTNRQ